MRAPNLPPPLIWYRHMRVGEKIFKMQQNDRRKQQNVRAITPRGKELQNVRAITPRGKELHKSPRGKIVYPIAQFFIRVTRFSGFRQVRINSRKK